MSGDTLCILTGPGVGNKEVSSPLVLVLMMGFTWMGLDVLKTVST
jgi:hypothetical protein